MPRVNGIVPTTYDNQNATLEYTGNWSLGTDADTPSSADPRPYHETSEALASVSLNFTNAVAIAINSPRNWGHWVYNVVSVVPAIFETRPIFTPFVVP